MTKKSLDAAAALTHSALRAGFPLSRTAGEGAERREAGEGTGVAAGTDRSDIARGDWVERHLPARTRPFARLARLDRPIGTWLLLFPGWWGLALAARRWPDPALMALFALGAVVMRGAGCTLNDIADRHYDARVARTRLRPIAERCGQGARGGRLSAGAVGNRRRGAAQPEPDQHQCSGSPFSD